MGSKTLTQFHIPKPVNRMGLGGMRIIIYHRLQPFTFIHTVHHLIRIPTVNIKTQHRRLQLFIHVKVKGKHRLDIVSIIAEEPGMHQLDTINNMTSNIPENRE
jgi:hypothetical protein